MLKGISAFLLVLLLMPIGHALMVLNEILLPDHKYLSAFLIGLLGVVFIIWGILNDTNRTLATIMGLLAGILIWTGWVEFSFVWVAEKLQVAPYMEDGSVATKPEYLVMISSLGLLSTMVLMYFFTKTNCTFFSWFQRRASAGRKIRFNSSRKPISMIVFMETIMIIWLFYIVLLVVYDPEIFGDRHPATYAVAYGSLIWSAILFAKLLRIRKFDYAVRYAVPTVVIFWNFIEVLGRWELFKEIWIHPFEHGIELGVMLLAMLAVVIYQLDLPFVSLRSGSK